MTLEDAELTSDALTGRLRVLQRKRGHRFSYDDVVTAWLAAQLAPDARSVLDLGCGIGSVLLMLADVLRFERGVGIEAQAESFALAERNLAASGLSERLRLVFGDLRAADCGSRARELADAATGFELVTGTPPYKPAGTATPSPDGQRAHARIELRGGVEDYLASAGRLLAPAGTCVVCMEAAGEARVQRGAESAGLRVWLRLRVIPRAGQPALFSVFALESAARAVHAAGGGGSALPLGAAGCDVLSALCSDQAGPTGLRASGELVLRDATGLRTPAACALRSFFGLQQQQEPPAAARRSRGR